MKKTSTTLLAGAGALSAMLVVPSVADAAPQQAYPNYCVDTGDVLCLFDGHGWTYGQLYGSNSSWNFGAGNNWNKRADVFMNNRATQDACVYNGENATGTARRIPAFQDRSYSNFGSSNKWVSPGASCG